MKNIIASLICLLVLTLAATPAPAQTQASTNNFKQQFLRHFNYASRVLSLAEAMPADTYSWQPSEEVYSVAKVYAHIARYNFLYLESSLGIPAPKDVNLETMESITKKEDVIAVLKQSIQHVKSAIQQMPNSKLSEPTELYGQTVNGQAVLMQLITHYSEHAGQAIAYARMNAIVPPWNR